jgi:hypothetical protein
MDRASGVPDKQSKGESASRRERMGSTRDAGWGNPFQVVPREREREEWDVEKKRERERGKEGM